MSENIENNTQVKEEKVNETKQPDIKQPTNMRVTSGLWLNRRGIYWGRWV